MKQVMKAALAAAALPMVAMPLGVAGATPASAAGSLAAPPSLLPPGPATVLTHGPSPWDMPRNLQGEPCAAPKTCEQVLYWWIISAPVYEIGVDENLVNLDRAIEDADGTKIVYAFSGGARIATAWLTHRAEQSEVPPEELSFLLLGNGTRKYGGLSTAFLGSKITAPPTRYSVVDVAREYDPIADWPDDKVNLLAMANALAAFNLVHMDYSEVDLDDPDNYVWAEDRTTYVFVPTKNLPLLQPLRNLGLDWLADQWEQPLRTIVDEAYDRPYLPAQPQGEDGDDDRRTLRASRSSAEERDTTESTDTAGAEAGETAPDDTAPDTDTQAAERLQDDDDPVALIDDDPVAVIDDDPVAAIDDDAETAQVSRPRHRKPLNGVTRALRGTSTTDRDSADRRTARTPDADRDA